MKSIVLDGEAKILANLLRKETGIVNQRSYGLAISSGIMRWGQLLMVLAGSLHQNFQGSVEFVSETLPGGTIAQFSCRHLALEFHERNRLVRCSATGKGAMQPFLVKLRSDSSTLFLMLVPLEPGQLFLVLSTLS